MAPKPALYHFCLLTQPEEGGLLYFHGTSTMQRPIASNDDYNAFVKDVSAQSGHEQGKVVVISLSRIS